MRGPIGAVLSAQQMLWQQLNKKIGDMGPDHVYMTYVAPKGRVGAVVGKAGAGLRQVREISGLEVKVDQNAKEGWGSCAFDGNMQSTLVAAELIHLLCIGKGGGSVSASDLEFTSAAAAQKAAKGAVAASQQSGQAAWTPWGDAKSASGTKGAAIPAWGAGQPTPIGSRGPPWQDPWSQSKPSRSAGAPWQDPWNEPKPSRAPSASASDSWASAEPWSNKPSRAPGASAIGSWASAEPLPKRQRVVDTSSKVGVAPAMLPPGGGASGGMMAPGAWAAGARAWR